MAFVDTSFLFAAVDRGDTYHDAAKGLFDELAGEPLITTSQVLGETWTLARSRLGHRQAAGLIDGVRHGGLYQVLHVDEPTESAALDWLQRRDERPYSFVDATSFQVMWSRRIDHVLTFDSDFEAAGFITLRA